MNDNEHTESLSRLPEDETRRALALEAAVKSLSPGISSSQVLRRADTFAVYIKTGRWS